MSFLGDIVNSIGGDRVPAPPKPLSRPPSTGQNQQIQESSKVVSRPRSNGTTPLNGTKRKAEDDTDNGQDKIIRHNTSGGPVNNRNRIIPSSMAKASKVPLEKAQLALKPQPEKTTVNTKPAGQPGVVGCSTAAASKLPAKGSYADFIARAKEATEQRKQVQVGTIKHQASSRERVSKVAERRREEQERAKGNKLRPESRPKSRGAVEKPRSASPSKKADASRLPKDPRPPLHAPQSSYKGTMGITSSRTGQSTSKSANTRNPRRYDEYLGTDEEDNSDVEDYGEDEYGSDASSDMEAGAFELDEEEQKTLRVAKEDDAKELATENRLRREKEERRQRLQGLASKRK